MNNAFRLYAGNSDNTRQPFFPPSGDAKKISAARVVRADPLEKML